MDRKSEFSQEIIVANPDGIRNPEPNASPLERNEKEKTCKDAAQKTCN